MQIVVAFTAAMLLKNRRKFYSFDYNHGSDVKTTYTRISNIVIIIIIRLTLSFISREEVIINKSLMSMYH